MPMSSSASSLHCESPSLSPRDQGRDEGGGDGTSSQGPTTASTNNNVGELVARAKKAAASLWMILHAQVRMYGDIVYIAYTFSTRPSLD